MTETTALGAAYLRDVAKRTQAPLISANVTAADGRPVAEPSRVVTAGVPILFLDYALGHRFRGGPPTAFRRVKSGTAVTCAASGAVRTAPRWSRATWLSSTRTGLPVARAISTWNSVSPSTSRGVSFRLPAIR